MKFDQNKHHYGNVTWVIKKIRHLSDCATLYVCLCLYVIDNVTKICLNIYHITQSTIIAPAIRDQPKFRGSGAQLLIVFNKPTKFEGSTYSHFLVLPRQRNGRKRK